MSVIIILIVFSLVLEVINFSAMPCFCLLIIFVIKFHVIYVVDVVNHTVYSIHVEQIIYIVLKHFN
jgi:hypothetical protein